MIWTCRQFMRRIIVYTAAVVLLSLAACKKESGDSNGDSLSDSEIQFSTASVAVTETKSVVSVEQSDTNTLKNNGFRVAGIWTGNTEYLNGTVSYDSSQKKYKLDEIKYWPLYGSMDFYAVYPTSLAINTDDPTSPFITFAADGSTDLITARTRVPNQTVANISFNHSLALVSIMCKGESGTALTYKVKKVQAVTSGSADFNFITWSDFSSTKTVDIYDDENGQDISCDTDFTAVGSSVTVFPTEMTLIVRYEIYQSGLLIQDIEATAVTPVALYPVMGYSNIYQCTLSNNASEIQFSVTVNDWQSKAYDVEM